MKNLVFGVFAPCGMTLESMRENFLKYLGPI